LVDAQEKSAITRSVAWGGDLIEQRTLNFNSIHRQEWSRVLLIRGEADGASRGEQATGCGLGTTPTGRRTEFTAFSANLEISAVCPD
jgi:hypothetical protein